MQKPKPGEYAPFYAGYIAKVPDANLIDLLIESEKSSNRFLTQLPPPKKGNYSYAEGKWTIKDLLQHLIDTERIMVYRALRFSRGDQNNLPGFDENEYAKKPTLQI